MLHQDFEFPIRILVPRPQPLIRSGARSVLVIVESFYSMDGDVCPLKELIEAAKELFPGGNAQFFVDEAHSGGVIGLHGSGLVNQLGLQREVAIRDITFGKALSSFGGGFTHYALPRPTACS